MISAFTLINQIICEQNIEEYDWLYFKLPSFLIEILIARILLSLVLWRLFLFYHFQLKMQQTPKQIPTQDRQPRLFPHDFTSISNQGLHLSPHSFCFYRVCMLLSITVLFTLLLLYGPELRNWAYLTYWGFTGVLLYFLIGVIESMAIRVFGNNLKLPLWRILHWMFQNLLCVQLMINGVFWFVFFPFIIYYHKTNNVPLLVIDVVQAFGAHLVPLSLLLIDMCNNLVCFWNRKVRKYTVAILLTYLAFNMVYTLEEGPIYPVMTYRDVLTYVFVVGNVIGTLITYEIVMALSVRFKNQRVLRLLKKEPMITRPFESEEKYQDLVQDAMENAKTAGLFMVQTSTTGASTDIVKSTNIPEIM